MTEDIAEARAMHDRQRDGHAVRLASVGLTFRPRYAAEIRVLNNFELEANRGQITVIAGRSGSGKTTALSIAAGLLPPDTGVVSWFETDITSLKSSARTDLRRATVGYVFQDGGLVETLTARENVALATIGVRKYRRNSIRAQELLRMLDLDEAAGRLPSQLSGGQRQRVGIARALYLDPPVLILDEPTASLDRHMADEVIDVLRNLAREGKALLLASHDPGVIAAADAHVSIE